MNAMIVPLQSLLCNGKVNTQGGPLPELGCTATRFLPIIRIQWPSTSN